MWRELWWAMAKGKKSEFDRIKATNVFEFWGVFDLWKEQMKLERSALERQAKRK
jgi:hypothetical protein